LISFIIIGQNEGWKLSNCLKSVFETISQNFLFNFEVIYVDSNSSDDSIERAKQFANVRVFRITGICNPAIGRNIGAKESSGDTLFFIDGDMELMPSFLPLVYDENKGLMQDFVSGQWINYNYSSEGKLLSKDNYESQNYTTRFEFITGGLFLIKRKLWFEMGGMKNKMKRCQDLDLALRLAKNNIFLLRRSELLAKHHTIPYSERKRIWRFLFSGEQLYRIVLLRENLLNKCEWKLFLRGNYTFIFLILFGFQAVLLRSFIFILPYFLLILIRTLFKRDRSLRLLLTNLLYYPLLEISLGFSLFLFWPSNHKEEYIAIR
jgi:glycosyltransferase involved in cell wall biosynthesis